MIVQFDNKQSYIDGKRCTFFSVRFPDIDIKVGDYMYLDEFDRFLTAGVIHHEEKGEKYVPLEEGPGYIQILDRYWGHDSQTADPILILLYDEPTLRTKD